MPETDGAHALPSLATALIGREENLRATRELLKNCEVHLLTLTGPPGVGKTRLAIALAASVRDEFADGVRFVDLAAINDSRLVVPTLVAAFGARATNTAPDLHSIARSLSSADALAVLDNFEHLVDAAVEIAHVLAVCPGLKILATSRTPLRISWEHQYQVPPLGLPSAGCRRLADALASPSLALFTTRARAVAPGLEFGERETRLLMELAWRLEGLPLAIELAAARLKALPLGSLVSGYERSLDLLGGGSEDQPVRHMNLRAAIDWSFNLLSPSLQSLFRELGVFAGTFELEAVAAIHGHSSGHVPVVEQLVDLVDASLVQPEPTHGAVPRFRMLETVREYAAERLATAPDEAEILERHAAYFLRVARQGAEEITGREQSSWLDRLDSNHGNFRAALRHFIEEGDVQSASMLVDALWRYWWRRGRLTDGRLMVEDLLAHPRIREDGQSRGRALLVAGLLAVWQSDYSEATQFLAGARSLAEELRADRTLGYALTFAGRVSRDLGHDDARDLLSRAVDVQRRTDDSWGLALALHFLGLACLPDDLAAAREAFQESESIFRELGGGGDVAMPLRGMGIVCFLWGDLAAARHYLERSVTDFLEQRDEWSVAMASQDLGYVSWMEGNAEEARERFGESLRNWRRLGNRRGQHGCLSGLAAVASYSSEPRLAAILLGAATEIAFREGITPEPTERASVDQIRQLVWERAGSGVFDSGFRYGTSLDIAGAVDIGLALAEASQVGTEPGAERLSRREREVAGLVRRGLSNRQIGAELFISEGTAGLHVKHILAKCGFASRAQIAAWAAETGIGSGEGPAPRKYPVREIRHG